MLTAQSKPSRKIVFVGGVFLLGMVALAVVVSARWGLVVFQPAVPDISSLYIASYQPTWVMVSVLLSVLGAYAAIVAATRGDTATDAQTQLLWVVVSSLTFGVGTWAMHFIGMLALSLPCHVGYALPLTMLSMLPAVLGGYVAFCMVGRKNMTHLPVSLASILLGAGIGTMHYTGMAAMRFDGLVRYNPTLFAMSMVVAVLMSYVALRFKGQRIVGQSHAIKVALILGAAVSATHYTAMAGAYFVSGDASAQASSLYTPASLAFIVSLATVFLALTTLSLAAVSRAKMATALLQAGEAELRIAATAFESQQGTTVADAHGVILRVNQAFTQITGYSAAEAVGQNPRILASGRHDSAFYQAMWASIGQTGQWQGEIWNRRKDGEVYPEWLAISAVKDAADQVTNYVATFSDISARKNAEVQINTLAFYDPLTHLPNRRLLLDRLTLALATVARHQTLGALLFVDLDNFKTLNDTLGFVKGDLLLEVVAQRLQHCVYESDTVARVGGDEFVVMLEDLSGNLADACRRAESVAEKIRQALNQSYPIGPLEHRSTPSIGVALFGDQAYASPDEPLKNAELAMFQAKSAGHNTIRFFDPKMEAEVLARAALEGDLRGALQQQQLVLFYQAQVVGKGRVVGAEALVRWQHPQRGLVSPAEFIPLAEETGLILPLGQWVLETACAQLALWATQPTMADLVLAVNVSAKQFHQSDFVAQVQAALTSSSTNPKRLKLELTESLLVSNVEDVIAKMAALKLLGISFSLDDFGTGYSSLVYLKRMPLDQLKIDQGFVRNILSDPNDAAIAKMVVALAESMGLAVIAEGVEEEAQKDFLAHLGCHAYQGYFFSRPVPIAEFEVLAQA
jgi:diguanylate cyclase (GGDEF)-like protein/PAS domain S-box-containing protein